MEKGYIVKKALSDDKKFNIVIPTYEHKYKLDVIINCFLAQTFEDWVMTIVCDGEPDEVYNNIVSRYSDIENISFHCLHKRYCDWGHTPREYGIYQNNCEWTIITGYDNYYVPIFLERFHKAIEMHSDCDFVFCDFILNHIINGRPYNGYINSKLEVGRIDIGNFAVKSDLLRKVGFPFREYAADWKLVETLIPMIKERQKSIIKIPETLYVHN